MRLPFFLASLVILIGASLVGGLFYGEVSVWIPCLVAAAGSAACAYANFMLLRARHRRGEIPNTEEAPAADDPIPWVDLFIIFGMNFYICLRLQQVADVVLHNLPLEGISRVGTTVAVLTIPLVMRSWRIIWYGRPPKPADGTDEEASE